MSDPFFDYMDREGQASRREYLDSQYARFTPLDDVRLATILPKEVGVPIERVILDRDETCATCRDPLFSGEVAYLSDVTHQIGCSEEHCREAAESKLQLMGGVSHV